MKITGYTLKEAIKMANLRLNALDGRFEEDLYYFDGDPKPDPAATADKQWELERKVALLQTAQQEYNQHNNVTINGDETTLAFAIKAVGGAGRIAKKWRKAAQGERMDRYSLRQARERDSDREYAEPSITKDEALEYASKAEARASEIRGVIAQANSSEIEIDWLTEDML